MLSCSSRVEVLISLVITGFDFEENLIASSGIRKELPEKNIWSFTGFILDQDLLDGGRKHCEVTDEMLSLLDVLVDGPFKEEEKDITLAFRGSRNQRVIDMKKSLKEQEVVLYLK